MKGSQSVDIVCPEDVVEYVRCSAPIWPANDRIKGQLSGQNIPGMMYGSVRKL